jgi:hypothetical protein
LRFNHARQDGVHVDGDADVAPPFDDPPVDAFPGDDDEFTDVIMDGSGVPFVDPVVPSTSDLSVDDEPPPLPPPVEGPWPAAGSADLPPLPPPSDAGSVASVGRVVGRALEVYKLPNGAKLSFYKSGNFEGTCGNPAHGRCRITRSGKVPTMRTVLRTPGMGRCVPYMICWLEFGCGSQLEHELYVPSHDERRACRTRLKNGGPNALAILGRERCRMDHDVEPEPEVI